MKPERRPREPAVFRAFSALFFGQAEEAAAEMARKLEKQEKKRLKKEKKRLAALALASSENSSSTLEECEVSGQANPQPRVKALGIGFLTAEQRMCYLTSWSQVQAFGLKSGPETSQTTS